MSNIKEVNNKEMEEVLQEILDENVSVESFQETAARSLETAEYDKVNAILLDYYNDKNKGDLQNDLKMELKLMVNEKVLSKLNSSKDLAKSKEEKVNEIGKEQNVDKDTLERATKNLDKKEKQGDKKEPNKEFDLRAELMKQVYIEEFKNYSQLVYKMKEKEAHYRQLTVGEEEGTKLVLYEKYLMNLEASYKGYANLKGLEEKAFNENDEIKDLKDKLANDLGKKEEYIDNKVHEKTLYLKELYEKRQEISKKICELNDNKSLRQNDIEYKKYMDYYQEEYKKLTYKMRDYDPTLEKYNEMIRIERENKQFANKELGYNSGVGFKAGYSDEQIKKDESNKFIKTTEENILEVQKKENQTQKDDMKKMINETVEFMGEDEIIKVEENLQTLEYALGIKDNENKEAQGKQAKVENEKLDRHIDKKISQKNEQDIKEQKNSAKNANIKDPTKYIGPFDNFRESQCVEKIYNEDEIANKDVLNERLNRVIKTYNKLNREDQITKKEQNELEIVR